MRITIAVAVAVLLASCRGEPTPRDYQNNPPKMTHPVTSSSQTPTAAGMPGPGPEPSKGVEGPNVTPTKKTPEQAPATTTVTTTVTTTHT